MNFSYWLASITVSTALVMAWQGLWWFFKIRDLEKANENYGRMLRNDTRIIEEQRQRNLKLSRENLDLQVEIDRIKLTQEEQKPFQGEWESCQGKFLRTTVGNLRIEAWLYMIRGEPRNRFLVKHNGIIVEYAKSLEEALSSAQKIRETFGPAEQKKSVPAEKWSSGCESLMGMVFRDDDGTPGVEVVGSRYPRQDLGDGK